jgi:hypothetical protein
VDTQSSSHLICDGKHFCPVCHVTKDCALGACSFPGEIKCDSCLYVEKYGGKTAAIIEKAIVVARLLDDAEQRNVTAGSEKPAWANQEDAVDWRTQVADALEGLDTEINVIQLRFKSRLGQSL